jgi:uncharacterized protein (UPF0248 family)
VRTVRDLLNELRWDARAATDEVVVAFRTREGGAEGVEEVAFRAIAEILAGGVTVEGGTFLPYHRFVAVRRGREVLWQSRS